MGMLKGLRLNIEVLIGTDCMPILTLYMLLSLHLSIWVPTLSHGVHSYRLRLRHHSFLLRFEAYNVPLISLDQLGLIYLLPLRLGVPVLHYI